MNLCISTEVKVTVYHVRSNTHPLCTEAARNAVSNLQLGFNGRLQRRPDYNPSFSASYSNSSRKQGCAIRIISFARS